MRPSVGHLPAVFGMAIASMIVTAPLYAQATRLTADDYARAERFLGGNTAPLVYGNSVQPRWMDDGRFWYANPVRGGTEYVVVDPSSA